MNHKNAEKPDSQALSDMLQAEIGDQDRGEFADFYLKNTAELLRDNPRQYLSYGAYWWAVKAMLIKRGVVDFGETVQQEWVDALSYESDALTIAAAWAYAQQRIDAGNIYNYVHIMPGKDGENFEYLLGDDELVLMAEVPAYFS